MRGETLLNMLDDGIDIAESDPFSAASSSCQPIRCSAKKLTSDVARCWAVELWRARYRNRGQIVVGRSIDVNAQFADQE